MKRRGLERWLRDHGAQFDRHGRSHDIWVALGTPERPVRTATVPRHRDIKPGTARAICDQLGVARPPGL